MCDLNDAIHKGPIKHVNFIIMFSTATKFMSTIQRVLKAILLEHNKPLKHNNNLKLAQHPL